MVPYNKPRKESLGDKIYSFDIPYCNSVSFIYNHTTIYISKLGAVKIDWKWRICYN
jgi:hypothetical protein